MDPTRPYLPSDTAQAAFVQEVALRMDEVSADTTIPRIAADKLYGFAVEACDEALKTAPLALVSKLSEALSDTDTIEAFGTVIGLRAALGTDTLRLAVAKLAHWPRSIFSAVTVEGEATGPYALEFNPHTRRPAAIPVAYVEPTAGGADLMLFPATTAQQSVDTIQVIRRTRPELVAPVAPDLASGIAWGAASRAFAAERYPDLSTQAALYGEAALSV